jgi:hypothetical protein
MATLNQYNITIETDGTVLVWEKGLDIPWADFPTKEEADAYIRHRQEEDELEEEFKALAGTLAERIAQQLEISYGEAVGLIRCWCNLNY